MNVKYVFWLNFVQFLALGLGMNNIAKTTIYVLNIVA